MSTAASNRRKHPRVPVGMTGVLYLNAISGDGFPCDVLDISLGGAFVHCTAPIRIGQTVFLEIHFQKSTVLQGKVVHDPADLQLESFHEPEKSIVRWARGSAKTGFGVEFVQLADAKKNFLERLHEHFSALRQKS